MKISDRQIREKLISLGASRLSDAELLAVIVREGTESLSALELAERLLAEFGGAVEGGSGAFAGLASADISKIRRTAGCGTVKATSIVAAAEFARRVAAEKSLSIDVVTSKDDVVKLFSPLAGLAHEEFWVLYLTSGGRVIERARMSQGGVAGTVVDHKLIVKRAVELLAGSLILVHNHPSGLAGPSGEDHTVTETIAVAASLFDINVVDHVIISRSGSYSFAENGSMPGREFKTGLQGSLTV